MKKILSILLTILVVLGLAACKRESGTIVSGDPKAQEILEQIEEMEEVLSGGWTINEEFDSSACSEEEIEILNKALEGFVGQGFTPIAVLGTQVVVGTNYMYLCEGTTVTAEPQKALKIVVVYKDLEGNATINDVYDFNIEDHLEDNDEQSEELAGGWTINENILTSESELFDKAFEEFVGAEYKPVVCLADQLVAGFNHAYLAIQTLVTAEPATRLAIVNIYEDLDGNCSINTIHVLNLTSLLD